jgi:hypothetical protein
LERTVPVGVAGFSRRFPWHSDPAAMAAISRNPTIYYYSISCTPHNPPLSPPCPVVPPVRNPRQEVCRTARTPKTARWPGPAQASAAAPAVRREICGNNRVLAETLWPGPGSQEDGDGPVSPMARDSALVTPGNRLPAAGKPNRNSLKKNVNVLGGFER